MNQGRTDGRDIEEAASRRFDRPLRKMTLTIDAVSGVVIAMLYLAYPMAGSYILSH